MKKYRKKPVVIDAVMLKSGGEFDAFCVQHGFEDKYKMNSDGSITISTLEGDMIAREGDYIIKGVEGEFYPCKPEIFMKTYEEVDSLTPTQQRVLMSAKEDKLI